jgi:type III pantothenate kinase
LKAKKDRDWLLAIDIGNTHVVVGILEGEELRGLFRLTSRVGRTADELVPILEALLKEQIDRIRGGGRVVIASVVPALTEAYEGDARRFLGIRPLLITADLPLGIRIAVPDPASVGADRIANAVAVADRYRLPAIVVDLGSATNFDVVLEGPRYVGGVIAPGILTSAEELFRRGARLAKVELRVPRRVVGKTTAECVQSGILYGAAGQIDGIVDRIKREIDVRRPTVVATGGLAEVLVSLCRNLKIVDPGLTIHGLRIAADRMRSRRGRRKSA